MEKQEGQRFTVIDGGKGKEKPDNPPFRLIKAFWDSAGAVMRVVSGRDKPQLKLQGGTDVPQSEIEQINIEELCSLSPENFLKSPQFFTLVKFYKSHNLDFAVDKEQLKRASVPTHVAHTVLKFFARSRFDLSQDALKSQMFNDFTAKVVEYLCGKNKVKEEDVPYEAADSKEDREVGSPDVIRRFNILGISLSHNDTGGYSDWCVFPRPTATAAVVTPSYGRKLDKITHGEMSAIERAFKFDPSKREKFITALLTGNPSFDNLITDNLQKI